MTWLVPSVRKAPPEITEKRHRYIPLVEPRAPPRSAVVDEMAESVPRPDPVRHVSFDEPLSRVSSPALPSSAPSSPRRHAIPLPRCRSSTPQSGAIPLSSAPAPITVDDSPLSSAETLTETPAEVKQAFSSRLTRVLQVRRPSRPSTIASTTASSSPASFSSEFGERVIPPGKAETGPVSDVKKPNNVERGRFTFLKKSKTIDVQTRRRTFSICLFLIVF